MFYCDKCNYILDITKYSSTNTKIKNKLIIDTPDDFYKKIIKSNKIDDLLNITFDKEQLLNWIKTKKKEDEKNKIIEIFEIKKNYNKYSKFIFKCKNCSNEYQIQPKQIILSKKLKKNNNSQNNLIMQNLNEHTKNFILNDNTYTRTKNFICPNIDCLNNKKNTLDKEAIIFRPNPNTFNTNYLCNLCKTVF